MNSLYIYKLIILEHKQYYRNIGLYILFKQTFKQILKAILLINKCWLVEYFLNLLYRIF